MGTIFISACFIMCSNDLIEYQPVGQNYSKFNIIWAQSGSIIGVYIGSLLTAYGKINGRVGHKNVIVGCITGGIVVGSVAPLLHNIGIIIMIGALMGVISGIYMNLLHPKLNQTFVYDNLGLFGPILIASLIGSALVTPITLLYYYKS